MRARRHLLALGLLLACGAADLDAQVRQDTTRARRPSRGVDVAPDQSPEELIRALQALPGYTATTYEGSGARYGADSAVVVLTGPATLERMGQTISADSLLTFDEARGIVCGYGSPVLSGEGQPLEAEQVCYDIERGVGMAIGARTQFTEQATWYVHGERVFTAEDDRLYGGDAEFTTCDLEIPHYHFAAENLKIVNDRLLVARDVTLNFGGVPVFWLPFIVQSLREGRRSGFLTPSFSITDVVQTGSGQRRQISNLGFYWAISDYMGAEAAFGWRSDEWVSSRVLFEYRWLRQFLRGSVNAQNYWRSGGRELTLNTNNSWQPDERTQVQVTGTYASSSDFVREQSYRPDELSRSLTSNAGVNRRFDWGSVNLGANRTQRILQDHVTLTAPSVSLTLQPITLATVPWGGVREELTWLGSTSFSSTYDDRSDELPETRADLSRFGQRDTRLHTVGAQSGIRFGKLSWNTSINGSDNLTEARSLFVLETDTTIAGVDTVFVDSVTALPETTVRQAQWTSRLSYQQNLIGTTTISPNVGVRGEFLQSPATGDELLTSPLSLDVGATLKMDVYGFWPGVGPFERFRHRLSPSISYNYSPEPNLAPADSVFGTNAREQNAIRIGLTQTFEAKRPAEARADTLENQAADATAETPAAGEPRRLDRETPLMLLSISTSAVTYDFAEEGRGGYGFTTPTLTNTLRSDLLRDLSLTVEHDLFDEAPLAEGQTQGDRSFDPHLSGLTANFGFGGDAWLFRWLGLGGDVTESQDDVADPDSVQVDLREEDTDDGIVPGRSGSGAGSRVGAGRVGGTTGTWRATFRYSLRRPRTQLVAGGQDNQQLGVTINFRPTANWSVNWSTDYSITESEFISNSLTLTRDLHRWAADFNLARTQTGNVVFEFEARLSDLPDLRIPYDQRSRPQNP